jgi:hypothetical protein
LSVAFAAGGGARRRAARQPALARKITLSYIMVA